MKVFGKLRRRFQEKRAARRQRWIEKKSNPSARRGNPGPGSHHYPGTGGH
jgi:hypothetical protein